MGLSYHFFDHTGDIAVRIEAASAAEVFEQAAVAMTDAVTDVATVQPAGAEHLALESPELDLLLVDFLSELLFRFETRGWLTARAAVEIFSSDVHRLGARIEGEPLDPSRHPVKVLLKAVTYHGLEVRHRGDLWVAQVIFDI